MSSASPSIPSACLAVAAAALLLQAAGQAAEPAAGQVPGPAPSSAPSPAGSGGSPAVSAAALAEAAEQLASPHFVRREAAARTLVAAGRPALEPLRRVIAAGDLEAASRAVEVLRDLLADADTELVTDAEQMLETVVAENRPDLAGLAATALEFHRLAATDDARRRLEAHGVLFRERQLSLRRVLEAEFNPSWTGGAAEWRLLPRVRSVAMVNAHGLPLDDAALEVLGRMPRPKRIELFGTGASEASVAALAARLPETVVDVRQGGRLGVTSAGGGGPCVVRVQPGSAADRCGMRDGDVILVADGRPVADFGDFTEVVSRRRPGEEMPLEVARQRPEGGIERFTYAARLDAW